MRKYFLEDPLHPQGGISIGVRRDDDCVFCEHCTDLWWDYTNLIYMTACDLGVERPSILKPCRSFKESEQCGYNITNATKAEPEPSWAKGGVRLEPDLDLEWTPEEEEVVLPKETIKEMCMMDFLKETKKTCEERNTCQGCFLEDEKGACKIGNSLPDDWKI